jgi:hypothetical protein
MQYSPQQELLRLLLSVGRNLELLEKQRRVLSLKGGKQKSGKIQNQENLVGQVVKMNTAAPLKGFLVKHQKPIMN